MADREVEGTKLPPELLDVIVDEISTTMVDDPDYKIALLNCSLVCRSFYTRASGHIFAKVSIVSKAGRDLEVNNILAKKLEDLYAILERNDSLAQRVKTFSLEVCFADTIKGSDTGRFLDNPHLPLIFDQFSSISKFEWINHSHPFPWIAFSSPIRSALRRLINRPSLTSLSFFAVESIPVDIFISNGNLEHLLLAHIDIDERTDDHLSSSATSHGTLKLKSLVNRNSANIVPQLLSKSPLIFSEMSVFRVWMRRSDEVNAAWAIMQSAAKTLETLDIEDMSHFRCTWNEFVYISTYTKTTFTPDSDPTMIPGPVDIGTLTNLCHFKVNCRIASGDGVIFPWGIYGLLNSGSAASRIENVEITIDWIDCQIGTESRRFVEETGWMALDEVLSGSKFHALQKVLLTLKLGYGWKTTRLSGDNPPHRIVSVKNYIQSLVAKMLPQTSRTPTKMVNINLLIYRSRYALNID
ncbi:hypothetical protein CVT25_009119 [Psilocybe cyanescens]|uniref:F-box domain-containing protein n=1 Tax=Psilocybe cyanescens TaxID=93625 RepID=A0A409XDS7_PSICY|nr:hypothetical protein CVT25_009119 [Psilocybe cyanescens]